MVWAQAITVHLIQAFCFFYYRVSLCLCAIFNVSHNAFYLQPDRIVRFRPCRTVIICCLMFYLHEVCRIDLHTANQYHPDQTLRRQTYVYIRVFFLSHGGYVIPASMRSCWIMCLRACHSAVFVQVALSFMWCLHMTVNMVSYILFRDHDAVISLLIWCSDDHRLRSCTQVREFSTVRKSNETQSNIMQTTF